MSDMDCTQCKYYLRSVFCQVYPDGIPMPILTGMTPHDRPLPGDGGRIFSPGPPDPDPVPILDLPGGSE